MHVTLNLNLFDFSFAKVCYTHKKPQFTMFSFTFRNEREKKTREDAETNEHLILIRFGGKDFGSKFRK